MEAKVDDDQMGTSGNTNKNSLIRNPVTNIPWISTQQMSNPIPPRTLRTRSAPYFNPALAEYHNKTIQNYKTVRRNHNIELLVAAFNGLTKTQARSALILADEELEKASFLVGMRMCFNRILMGSHHNRLKATKTMYESNFFSNVDLIRLNEIIFGKNHCAELSLINENSNTVPVNNNRLIDANSAEMDSESIDDPNSQGKVGVAIKRVAGSYKADVLF